MQKITQEKIPNFTILHNEEKWRKLYIYKNIDHIDIMLLR